MMTKTRASSGVEVRPGAVQDRWLPEEEERLMLGPEPCDEWFVSENDAVAGPLSERRINDLIYWGKVSERAFVANGDCSAWIPIQNSAFARAMAERLAQEASGRAPRRSAPARSIIQSERGMFGLLLAGMVAVSIVVAALAV
jgi:hypothetical protein